MLQCCFERMCTPVFSLLETVRAILNRMGDKMCHSFMFLFAVRSVHIVEFVRWAKIFSFFCSSLALPVSTDVTSYENLFVDLSFMLCTDSFPIALAS